MKAIPVTRPATVIETLQAGATDPLSKKKNAVAAKQPIDTSQNDIPVKSLVARISAALAEPVIPKKVTAANASVLNFLMKNSLVVSFLLSLYINYQDK